MIINLNDETLDERHLDDDAFPKKHYHSPKNTGRFPKNTWNIPKEPLEYAQRTTAKFPKNNWNSCR